MGYDKYKEDVRTGKGYGLPYGASPYRPLSLTPIDECCCFTAEDITLAQTCPDGGGPAVKQCVTIGDGYLVRIICVDGPTYDFFTDPTPTPVCQGPGDPGLVDITMEKYLELRGIQAAECGD